MRFIIIFFLLNYASTTAVRCPICRREDHRSEDICGLSQIKGQFYEYKMLSIYHVQIARGNLNVLQ